MSIFSMIYSTTVDTACSLFNRCCPRRRRSERPIAPSDERFRQLQEETTTTAALARIIDVGAAHRSTGTYAKLKDLVKVQPLIVNGIEPAASFIITKPLVTGTLNTLVAAKELRITVLALTTFLVCGAIFGFKVPADSKIAALSLSMIVLVPALIEKFLISVSTETHISRIDSTQRAVLALSQGVENLAYFMQAMSGMLAAYTVLQLYKDPSRGFDTPLSQTSMIVAASLGIMPNVVAKLLRDVEAAVLRPCKNAVRAGYVTSQLIDSPIEALSSASQLEREKALLKLPPEIRDAYFASLRATKTYVTRHQALAPLIQQSQRDLDKASTDITLENAKDLETYRTFMDSVYRIFSSVSAENLQERKDQKIASLTAARRRIEESLQSHIQNDEAQAEILATQNTILDDLLARRDVKPEIREIINQLKRTLPSHYQFVNKCKTIATTIAIAKTTAKVTAGAAALATAATATFGSGNAQVLAQQIGRRGITAAGSVTRAYLEYEAKKQRIFTAAHDLAIGSVAKIASPIISKLALNILIPMAIRHIYDFYDPSLSFYASQTASFYGWVAFTHLMLGLNSVYSEEKFLASTREPVITAAHKVVDFLLHKPQSYGEIFRLERPLGGRTSTQAHAALDTLIDSMTDSEELLVPRAQTALTALADLGLATRVINDQKRKSLLELRTLASDALTPIDSFTQAGSIDSGCTYIGAALSAIRAGASIAQRTGHIGFFTSWAVQGAVFVIDVPLSAAERILRRSVFGSPQPAPLLLEDAVQDPLEHSAIARRGAGAVATAAEAGSDALVVHAPAITRSDSNLRLSIMALWQLSNVKRKDARLRFQMASLKNVTQEEAISKL